MTAAAKVDLVPIEDYPCDLCHSTPGISFSDTYWVCDQCRASITLGLRAEQAQIRHGMARRGMVRPGAAWQGEGANGAKGEKSIGTGLRKKARN